MKNPQRTSQVRESLTSPSDLAANKRGEITDSQRERISVIHQWVKIVTSWYGVILVLLILLSFISPASLYILPVWGWIIFLLCGSGYWIWIYLRARKVEQGLKDGRIEQIEGVVTEDFKLKTSTGKINSIDPIQSGVLEPGKYHFFILPNSRLLVSAEKIDTQVHDILHAPDAPDRRYMVR